MIFTVDPKDLSAAMNIAGRVIPQKTPWPILTNIKIIAANERVTLIGSDSDTTFEVDVPANIQSEGAACLPFQPLAKFCTAARGKEIRVATSATGAKVSSGRSRVGLNVARLEDYPNYNPAEGDPAELDAPTFCQALRFCLAAASDDEVRYHIAGVNFAEQAGEVHVWGTDGKSAHKAVIRDLDSIGGGSTLPRPAAMVVLGAAEKAETVKFMACDRGWHFTAGTMRIWGKVIDNTSMQFPDMDKVVSRFGDWYELFVASRDEFTSAIGIATVGAEQDSDNARAVVLHVEEDERVILKGFKPSTGVTQAGVAEMDCEGRAFFAAPLSAKQLQAVLSATKDDEFVVEGCNSGDGTSAARISPAQQSAVLTLSAVVMAMRASMAEMGIETGEVAA